MSGYSKYGAVRVTDTEYGAFDSKSEYRRHQELVLLERAGEIKNLKRQPKFDIVVNGIKICSYRADWEYDESGEHVVEDYKGYRTAEYLLKKKLIKALYGVDIRETGADVNDIRALVERRKKSLDERI